MIAGLSLNDDAEIPRGAVPRQAGQFHRCIILRRFGAGWKDCMINRRAAIVAAGGTLLTWTAFGLRGQGLPARPRIATLSAFARTDVDPFLDEVRVELGRLGWVDGRNVELMAARTTEGRNDLLPALAGEIVAQRPDVILVQSTPATLALKNATQSIPIVMVGAGNPVESGLVTELRKPGGNVTGSSYLADESVRKVLELLVEAAPRVRSVAMFANPSNQAAAAMVVRLRADVDARGLRLQVAEVTHVDDFERAFAAIRREQAEAILIPPEPLIRTNREKIAAFAQAQRLPVFVAGSKRYLPTTGLMSYGPTSTQYALVTARYVDRILKGAPPGDLPVEQPAKFELVINIGVARGLGLAIPNSLLQRADEVVP